MDKTKEKTKKDKPKNSLKAHFKHLLYNGDMTSITCFVIIVVTMIIMMKLPAKYAFYQVMCLLVVFAEISELFSYVMHHRYNGKVIIVRKLGKYYMNQRSPISKMDDAECCIERLDQEIVDSAKKIVIDKKKDLYLTTHYHILKDLKAYEDQIEIIYDPNDYLLKDMSGLKKSLKKSCPMCNKCIKSDVCKLSKPQTVKMYNVLLKPIKNSGKKKEEP